MLPITHEQRLDRLEAVVQVLAEDQVSLQKLIADLATETRKGFEQVARQFAETDRRMQEMSRQTDERIDKLVSAIGQMIRREGPSGS